MEQLQMIDKFSTKMRWRIQTIECDDSDFPAVGYVPAAGGEF
jgi:hypothetical protein